MRQVKVVGNQTMTHYHGYTIMQQEGALHCSYCYRVVNPHVPRSFIWHEASDTLRVYIDALHQRRRDITEPIEMRRAATDLTYAEEPRGPVVQISREMLLLVLLGEMPLELPAGAVLTMRAEKGRFWTESFIAELAATGMIDHIHQAVLDWVRAGRPIVLPDAMEHLPKRVPASCGHNLDLAEQAGVGLHPRLGICHQPHETPLASGSLEDGTLEVLSRMHVPGGTPYVIRRIYASDGTTLLATQTAWTAEGPWREVAA